MSFCRFYPFGVPVIIAALVGMLAIFALRARADDGDFRPIVEAEMPAGFPQYTPVGELQIKQYPPYRKAQASSNAGSAFWTLFSHIKKNEISMTAPVEMTYTDSEKPEQGAMAFLYGRPDIGWPGTQGSVEVIDLQPMLVLSTGVRGPRTAKSVAEARDRLKAWLADNTDHYSADGQLRVMAYNSPFVPRDRNYFEVEIPIRPRHPSSSSQRPI